MYSGPRREGFADSHVLEGGDEDIAETDDVLVLDVLE